MTQTIKPSDALTDDDRRKIDEQIRHASKVLFSTTGELNDMGVTPPALATACAMNYVNLVAAMHYFMGLSQEEAIKNCHGAVDMLEGFVGEVYAQLEAAKNPAEGEAAAA